MRRQFGWCLGQVPWSENGGAWWSKASVLRKGQWSSGGSLDEGFQKGLVIGALQVSLDMSNELGRDIEGAAPSAPVPEQPIGMPMDPSLLALARAAFHRRIDPP